MTEEYYMIMTLDDNNTKSFHCKFKIEILPLIYVMTYTSNINIILHIHFPTLHWIVSSYQNKRTYKINQIYTTTIQVQCN